MEMCRQFTAQAFQLRFFRADIIKAQIEEMGNVIGEMGNQGKDQTRSRRCTVPSDMYRNTGHV